MPKMSVWDEPSMAKKASNPLSYLYPSSSHNLSSSNRISPTSSNANEMLMNKNNLVNSFENSQTSQTNAWSTTNSTTKTTPNTPSKSCTTKLGTCIKSSNFRFTLLGIFIGLVISLGAIIPIVLIWQLSSTTTTTTVKTATQTTSATGSAVSGSLKSTTGFSSCGIYFCEQNVNFTFNMTITSLSASIIIQRGGFNLSTHGSYTSFPFIPTMSNQTTSTQLTFQFSFTSGQITAGTYIIAAQFILPGVNRTMSSDTYSITTTNICGQVNTVSGTF